MKRLFYLVIIITLPVILFFQFWKYRKFNPPTDYAFSINQDIDPNYHDPEVVKRYYLTSQEVGTYARHIWKEHGVDVRFADMTDPEEKEYVQIYNSLIASAQFLEKKLLKSVELKDQGKTNEEIALWEKGIPESTPAVVEIAQLGDKNDLVRSIQVQLNRQGFEVEIDGIFRRETLQAVQEYQQTNQLPVTGIIDIETFLKLMK